MDMNFLGNERLILVMNSILKEVHLSNLLKTNEGLYKTGEISKEEYVKCLKTFHEYSKEFQEAAIERVNCSYEIVQQYNNLQGIL